MPDFRYRGLKVLVPVVLLAASWLAKADVCVSRGSRNGKSCSNSKDDDESLVETTPTMVQREVLEFAMKVDEEHRESLDIGTTAPRLTKVEVLEDKAPDALLLKMAEPELVAARLSKVEAREVAAPDAPLSRVEATSAPRMVVQPHQQLFGKSLAGSDPEAGNSGDEDTFWQAFDRKYNASAAAGAQLLRSMKRQVAVKFREFLLRLGVSKLLELSTTSISWTWVFFVPLLMVGVILMMAWWKDVVPSKESDISWDQNCPRPARGSLRQALSMPQTQQVTQTSRPPTFIGLRASQGKPSELTHGKTPQKSAASLVLSERRSTTPLSARADTQKPYVDDLAGEPLCSELVVPENKECSLLLPEIKESKFNMSGVLSIDDVYGMDVLYAAYSLAARPPDGPHDLPGNGKRLILRSVMEDIILASCKDAKPEAGGPPQLVIFNKSEEPFGILRATSPGPKSSYVVSLSTGKKLSIRRDIQTQSTCVVNEHGWLLACSEDAAPRGRTICISPQVDVGLMTLTMLGIDILDITMAARRCSDQASPCGPQPCRA